MRRFGFGVLLLWAWDLGLNGESRALGANTFITIIIVIIIVITIVIIIIPIISILVMIIIIFSDLGRWRISLPSQVLVEGSFVEAACFRMSWVSW